MTLTFPPQTSPTNYATTANYLNNWINAVNGAATDYLNSLTDLKAIEFSQVGDLPDFTSIIWTGGSVGALVPPIAPVLTIGNIQDLLNRMNALLAPTSPTVVFSYTEPGYSSGLRDPMIAKLLFDLMNGGYGIDVNDETAMLGRTRDREAMIAVANVDEVKRQAAAMSFTMPQGTLFEQVQKVNQDYMGKVSSVNRDIFIDRAKRFVENRQFVIEKVLASESQSIALYNAIQDRALMVARVTVEMAIALFDAGIKVYMAQIDALKSIALANLETVIAQTKLYDSQVQAYAALVNAVVSISTVNIANSRNILDRDKAAHQARVDIIRFRLQELMATVENRKQINQFATEFFRTEVGAAMNGMNGLAVQSGTV